MTNNLLKEQERITELFVAFSTLAKANSAIGKTDFNKVSETVLIPLFKEIFELPNLINLNTKKENYPGIDLGDEKAGVAFQVTATSESRKIKETLTTFVEKELYKTFPRLIVYILTDKKESYPEKAFADVIGDKFDFNISTDILDYRNLLRKCQDYQIDKASRIRRILAANFGRADYSVFNENQKEPHEEVFLNLVEFRMPKNLFIADLAIDRNSIIQNSNYAVKYDDPTRTIIRHYILEQLKLDFFSGWHLFGNQIISFHDLNDSNLFLSNIIDHGTIESITTESFYNIRGKIDPDRENVFKTLLRKTFQEQLYQLYIEWQHREGLFIFVEDGNEKKTIKTRKKKKDDDPTIEDIIFKRFEKWTGEKESTRAVLEIFMKEALPDEPWYFKHRAFEAKFKRINNKWFLLILPDWYFSYDGFNKSEHHADDLKWLKRKANTGIVFTDFRFICAYLKNKSNDLLQSQKLTTFLTFGETVSFDNAPFLFDEAWNPPELKKKKKSEEEESDETVVEDTSPTLFDL